MKLYNIEKYMETVKAKAANLYEQLGISSEEARIAYAIAESSIQYAYEGLLQNRRIITPLKRNILKNILGKGIDMSVLEEYLKYSLIINKLNTALKNNGKYVFQKLISETADADLCDICKTYVVHDYTDEEDDAIVVYEINSELWCFNTVHVEEKEWAHDFPELASTIQQYNA